MKRTLYTIGICCLLLIACSEPKAHKEMLERAIAVMDEQPDSALMILDSLGQHQAGFGKHFRMQYLLHRLNALNKVDSLFRSTDEAKELTDYFDDHGIPNEQMLAYYLLGRAYYDLHEAPMALNCFQTASERADTTAPDCNYRQLSRVYGQMSKIFYQQGLYKHELICEDLSAKYAWTGKDTLEALISLGDKIFVYSLMHKPDSAIIICEKVSALFTQYGYKDYSAAYLSSILRDLLDKGETKKVEKYIHTYEAESGYFDSDNNIEKGRESYYYNKGLYFMAIEKYDSAEYIFRKELREGKDFNNQNAGSRGLALLFQQKHMPDSAAKYALYSYEMNDSVYAHRTTKEVEQMMGMYDYSRNQVIARQAEEKAERERLIVWIVLSTMIALILSVAYISREVYKKRREMREAYSRKVSDLAKAQEDITRLRSLAVDTEVLNALITEKETEMHKMANDIESYKERLGIQKKSAELSLEESDVYHDLVKKAGKASELTYDDWHQINVMTIEVFPNFYKFISSKKLELNDKEFKTCILIRMHFAPKDIANMLGVSQAYISKLRIQMIPKLFGVKGNSKELDKKLLQIT